MSHQDNAEMEPGSGDASSCCSESMPTSQMQAMQIARQYPTLPKADLYHFLLVTPLNTLLAGFLPTRDLFHLQFLNRATFTLLNSNALLLKVYYSSTRLSSFIPFMVDDSFISSFLTPSYLDLPDGSRAVRNTYSMHIAHLHLNFCTRISNRALQSIALNIGSNLLTLNLEGGGRSRINEAGMRGLFAACTNLTQLDLSGFYQLNMVDTMSSLVTHCGQVTDLSLNGCSQMNDQAVSTMCRGLKLRKLYLNCSNVTDLGLQHIATAFKSDLEVLHVGYCGSITDRGMASLVNSCRQLHDLNLYGCYGLSRHALSYLRLCPLLETVDISRIHALDDSSIAEWILPTAQLQHQQQVILQLGNAPTSGTASTTAAAACSHPDYNANLPQVFAAQSQHPDPLLQQHAVTRLRSVSLDSCSRVTSLGLKVLLEHSPSLTFLNAFGVQNLSTLALHSLLRIVVDQRLPLRQIEIGGHTELNAREVEALRQQFTQIKF